MILFFTFGTFAVSLAYDSVPDGRLYAIELRHLSATDPVQLYSQVLPVGLQFESGDVPEAPRLCLQGYAFSSSDRIESLMPYHPSPAHAAKVSLQILQSALLL